MKIVIWNIRGMGRLARIRQLKELMAKEKPDIIGLQETIKKSFSERELEALAPGGGYKWGWIAASGHSGGILLGAKEDILQIEDWETGTFYVGATIRDRLTNVRWDCLTVYGPAQHDRSEEFLEELRIRCEKAVLPLLIGGDFNLIREEKDKNSGGGNTKLMHAFNNFIEKADLREIYRGGGGYTWTNKQLKPIQSNLDRILVTTEWEGKFPLATLNSRTRVGSDHCPLVLDTGEGKLNRTSQFRFERFWIKEEGFIELVNTKWRTLVSKWPDAAYSLDKWHGGLCGLRQYLHGWSNNIRGDYKRAKLRLTKEMEDIDKKQNKGEADEDILAKRFSLEIELEKLMEAEEIYWQQRGSERWILEGDANTNFFHLIANGRRRKKIITCLEHDGGEVTDKEGI